MLIWYAGYDLEEYNFYAHSDFRVPIPRTVEAVITPDTLDGEYDQGSVFDENQFNIEGILVCDNLVMRASYISNLLRLFQDNSMNFLTLEGHPERGLLCKRNGPVSTPYSQHGIDISIPMLAPDPLWYSVTEHTKAGAGDLYNAGNMYSGAVISLQGPVTDPHITIGSQVIIYTGSLTSNDVLKIDTKNKTALFNSSNATGKLNGVFPMLAPGSNGIVTSGGTLSSVWRDCWLSS